MPIVKNLLILLFIINTTYAKGLSAVKDAEAIYQLKQQLKQLKEQLKYTQQLLDSVKGQKLDKIITTIDDNIPESWSSMYPPSEVSIVKATQYEDKQSELLLKTYDIMRNNYDNAQIRAKNIEKLMQKATSTQDLKEAQDLQNQIALEQLALQNNANQIKQMQNMIENEQKLASENIKLQNLCYSEKMYEEKLSEELASAERPEEVWRGPPMSQKCKDFFSGEEPKIQQVSNNKNLKRVTRIKDKDGNVIEERIDGSRSWRNNNPGNLECGAYANKKGATGCDGKFAVFPNKATGDKAREDLIFNSKNYRNKNLRDAIIRYAPKNENNVKAYLNTIKNNGININKKMNSYNKIEKQKILDAMQKQEGFKPGKSIKPSNFQ